MTIKNTGDGHLVFLSKPMDSRPKLLNFFWFILFFFTGGRFLHEALHGENMRVVVFACVVAVLFFVLSYRFINKAFLSEQLFIGSGELRLIKKGFTTRVRVFPIAGVSQFRHLEKAPATEHPLAGKSFDSPGFQTQQVMIKELNGNARMAFDYDGRVISFGENVYSWEFDEIAALVAAAGGGVATAPAGSMAPDVSMAPGGSAGPRVDGGVAVETEPDGVGDHFRLPGEPEPVVWKMPEPPPESPADEAEGSPGESV